MQALDLEQTYAPVREAQSKRATEKLDAMRTLFPDSKSHLFKKADLTAGDAALVDHLFYLALDLAKANRTSELEQLGAALTHVQEYGQTPGGLRNVSYRNCIYIADSAFQSPIYLYDFARKEVEDAPSWLENARQYLISTDFNDFVTQAMGLLIELDPKNDDEHSESYTITALHASIFMDSHSMAARNAETLVHEATHNWLNYLFDFYDEPLPKSPKWLSPWRGVERPVAGMVHAFAAFSFVVLFLRTARQRIELPANELAYAKSQEKEQVFRLGAMQDDFNTIMSYIRAPIIVNVVSQAYHAAIKESDA